MTQYRERTLEIRDFILRHVEKHPHDITAFTMDEFSISRPAVLRHIQNLIRDDLLEARGLTKDRRYTLKPIAELELPLQITEGLSEDRIWRQNIRPLLDGLPANVREICVYGFTEMLNNVVDHSEGTLAAVTLTYTASSIEILVIDDGTGIFNKIQTVLGLEDPRHVVLELSKGKLTTDPERHTGEGVFFTSRAFDRFSILSGGLFFSRDNPGSEWLFEKDSQQTPRKGTIIGLRIAPYSDRRIQDVFAQYTTEADDYSFSRTIVPVALAQYGNENLVSRSQAKRLLARFDRFREVILDFSTVETIGPAFADEVFRVFPKRHPQVHLYPVGANDQVMKMILRAIEDPEIWRDKLTNDLARLKLGA